MPCLTGPSGSGFMAVFPFGNVGQYLSWLGIGLPFAVIAADNLPHETAPTSPPVE